MPITPEEAETEYNKMQSEYKEKQTKEYKDKKKIENMERTIDNWLKYKYHNRTVVYCNLGYKNISILEEQEDCISDPIPKKQREIIRQHYEEKGWKVEWEEKGTTIRIRMEAY